MSADFKWGAIVHVHSDGRLKQMLVIPQNELTSHVVWMLGNDSDGYTDDPGHIFTRASRLYLGIKERNNNARNHNGTSNRVGKHVQRTHKIKPTATCCAHRGIGEKIDQ